MEAHLMYRGQNFDAEREPPPNHNDLEQDLELGTLFDAMAAGDEFLRWVARAAVLSMLTDPDQIRYRQEVLADCIARSDVVIRIYEVAVEAVERERRIYRGMFRSPDLILHTSIEVLEMLVELLARLRKIAEDEAEGFRSDGFQTLFAMLRAELDDEYFASVKDHLKRLRFRAGVLVSAQLGKGNKGTRYTLRRLPSLRPSWIQRLTEKQAPSYTVVIPDRDEAGARALAELRGRGINLAANALAQSTDHILSFFRMLRAELGFYRGCLNLHGRLTERGEQVCYPEPLPVAETTFSCEGMYDVCLRLSMPDPVVSSDVVAVGSSLVMITGANQGGKSTFLRSVGLTQLMTQCGMFVPAKSVTANVCTGVFTHYKRQEDATMESGKLDEELVRMGAIADEIRPRSLLLCNESFAATNEREGSEIARQVVRAFREHGVKIFFVTHFYDLAYGLYSEAGNSALFLRAEREAGGHRTFRVVPGEPESTSYGIDLYREVFPDPAAASG